MEETDVSETSEIYKRNVIIHQKVKTKTEKRSPNQRTSRQESEISTFKINDKVWLIKGIKMASHEPSCLQGMKAHTLL